MTLPSPGPDVVSVLLRSMRHLRFLELHLGRCSSQAAAIVNACLHVEDVMLHSSTSGAVNATELQQLDASELDQLQKPALLTGLSQLRRLTLNNCTMGPVEGHRRAGELQFHDWDGSLLATEHNTVLATAERNIEAIQRCRQHRTSQLLPNCLAMRQLQELIVSVGPWDIANEMLYDVGSRFPQLTCLEIHFDSHSERADWCDEYKPGQEDAYENECDLDEKAQWGRLGLSCIRHDALRELHLFGSHPDADDGAEWSGPQHRMVIECPELRTFTITGDGSANLDRVELDSPKLLDISINASGTCAELFVLMRAQPTNRRRLSIREEECRFGGPVSSPWPVELLPAMRGLLALEPRMHIELRKSPGQD
ncbi:hypothetical protein WJX72_004578 [[Myrmecia] bisecta]|uniref:Uncharacterized protein n=1 Tax=[Myrmecia] bisecta TaxID=41462 RepID=A0AAW1P779_9CHLO